MKNILTAGKRVEYKNPKGRGLHIYFPADHRVIGTILKYVSSECVVCTFPGLTEGHNSKEHGITDYSIWSTYEQFLTLIDVKCAISGQPTSDFVELEGQFYDRGSLEALV